LRDSCGHTAPGPAIFFTVCSSISFEQHLPGGAHQVGEELVQVVDVRLDVVTRLFSAMVDSVAVEPDVPPRFAAWSPTTRCVSTNTCSTSYSSFWIGTVGFG
jgi:hypothetical protein